MFEKANNIQEKTKDDWKYVFPVEETELPYAFLRQPDQNSPRKTVYSSIHFDGKVFRRQEDKTEISIQDFVNFLRNKFGAEKIILSCCFPDAAKEVIGELPNVEVLGSGKCKVRTIYNDRKKLITVESTC